ncbi:hypothetical protein [Micromonospora haikouensis]|uniref:hypothetical protein n=1 Tax=Micromonospora haikouensis TaxID=686309 RepID=UPI003D757231
MRICAACGNREKYLIRIYRWGVPHGHSGHQINYRWTDLYACPGCDAGRLVVFDHDCFAPPFEEPWDMSWEWQVAADGVRCLQTTLARCPDPMEPSCSCAVHLSLRASSESSKPHDATATVEMKDDGSPQFRFSGTP